MKYVNLISWCQTARVGQTIEYYRGYLYADRKLRADKSKIVDCANQAWAAYDKGLVTLYQIKNGPSDYSYMARKRKK